MRVAKVVVAVGIAATLTACSGSSTAHRQTGDRGPVSVSPTAPGGTGSTAPTPTGSPSTAAVEQPVLKAKPAPFTSPVSFSDGVLVSVTKAVKGTVTGTGPGVLTGTPTATFTLRFTNHTAKALDLHHVLVLASYGTAHALAAPVYDAADIQDFATAVRPGRSAVTRYQFAVPAKALGNVTLEVKFDSTHAAALFKGRVRITKD